MALAPLAGLASLIEGIRLLARPGLRRYVIWPLGINILVFAAALYWAAGRSQGLIAWLQSLLPTLPDWLSWLELGLAWLLWPLFVLLALVLVFQGFTLIANLIAAPFNGLLSGQVERLLRGAPAPSETSPAAGPGQLLGCAAKAFIDELRKMLHLLLWAIPILILSLLVPLIGPFLWFTFTAWTLALEYLDYPMANQGLGARAIRRRLRARPVLSLGFGAATAALTLIPVVNFIAMPSAVAGATVLWIRELEKDSD